MQLFVCRFAPFFCLFLLLICPHSKSNDDFHWPITEQVFLDLKTTLFEEAKRSMTKKPILGDEKLSNDINNRLKDLNITNQHYEIIHHALTMRLFHELMQYAAFNSVLFNSIVEQQFSIYTDDGFQVCFCRQPLCNSSNFLRFLSPSTH